MSAGTGIEHSEMNANATEPVHFLQLWIEPAKRGIAPGYEQDVMPPMMKPQQFDPNAGPYADEGAVTLYADARVYRASLQPGASLDVPIPSGRHSWMQVARGDAVANGQWLAAGDGLAISDEPNLPLTGGVTAAELLVFELA